MPRATRIFRIFVSSTFEDMAAERNALQTDVFPRLHKLCAEHDARFQAIDLRWGVRDEATLDQQTMGVCLAELARCQTTTPRPNFVVLLGDRYGWRPPPAEVPADEFEAIRAAVTEAEAAAALDQWYERDDNARLRRDDDAAPQALYLLQPRDPDGPYGTSDDDAERAAKSAAWGRVEHTLQQTLADGATALGLPEERLLRYTGSATHQEIAAGLLQVDGAEQHVFTFSRAIDKWPAFPLPEAGSPKGYVDPLFGPGEPGGRQLTGRDDQAAGLLADLRNALQRRLGDHFKAYQAAWVGYDETDQKKPPITTDHLAQLCDDVYESLAAIILEECERLEAVDEEKAIRDFAEDRSRHFVGRADTLAEIESYLRDGADQPLVLWGESGTGKSAVMARVMLTLDRVQPSAEVVCRFIGATSGSADVRALLDNVSRKIDRTYDVQIEDAGTSYEDLIKHFPTRLAAATPDKPLVVMLDALDQLSDANNARSLAWLPAGVPANCRVIVSTTPGECKTALERKLAEERLLQLKEMSKDEGEELLGLWLADAERTLQPGQQTAVIGRFLGCAIPLYLKLAFEEARRWHSYDPARDLAPDVTGLITDLYERLGLPQNHGELLVERSLGYLAAARFGLSEEELLGALCQDDEFFAAFATQAHHDLPGIEAGVALAVEDLPASERRDLPIAVWSRLYYDLEPYLSERDEEDAHVLTFYHRQLREVAMSRYLAEDGWKIDEETPLTAVGKARHQTLADYFGRLADPEPPDDEGFHSWSGEYRRAFAELPYHLTLAQQWDGVYAALTDFTFLEKKSAMVAVDRRDGTGGDAKTVYNGPYQLQDDYRLALDAFPAE
jgi:NACHT domain- and WD repeat-containing protein